MDEEVLKEYQKINDKIKLVESFISLHLRREQIEPQIQELAKKTEEVKSLIQQCNHVMKTEYTPALEEYETLMAKMQMQQLQVLEFVLEKKKAKENDSRNGNVPNQQFLQVKSNTGAILSEKKALSAQKGGNKMYLDAYLQSPFVRKTRPLPVSLQFMDFETEVTKEMFESIPKYMRGRDTLDDLLHFLDTVLVPCFNEKYQLLHRHRDCIRNHADLDLWKIYKDQASYFPGQNFITQGDISRKIKKMLDKKSQNKITMLRHLGILQEQRKAQTVCYIWTANNAMK